MVLDVTSGNYTDVISSFSSSASTTFRICSPRHRLLDVPGLYVHGLRHQVLDLRHDSVPTFLDVHAELLMEELSMVHLHCSGQWIFTSGYRHTTLVSGSFSLNNVLVSPNLIKSLISIRQFTRDNNCSVEFYPLGCFVKNLETQKILVRCNSSGPIYPLRLPTAAALVVGSSSSLWHHRLGHPSHEALSKVAPMIPTCNKEIIVMRVS